MMRVARAVAALLVCAVSLEASADRRNFAFTYEPKIMSQGSVELEYYMTGVLVPRSALDDELDWGWAHQAEIEYGLTDHVDLAMYQMFGTSGWTGYKLRARYRPFFPGELPIAFLVYLEFIHLANGDVALEEKLVLGRAFGPVVVSLDSTVEQGPLNGDIGFKLIESLGIGWEVVPWFSFSLETQLRMAWQPREVYTSPDPELEFVGPNLYMGPTVSFAHGHMFWNASFAALVTGEELAARYLFRILWGVGL